MIVPVDVVLDGRLLASSQSAQLRAGTVEVPIDPYARALATTVRSEARRIILERGGRRFVLVLGSRRGYCGTTAVALPIAPYLRAGSTIIPLAATARALGATVRYDPATRTVLVETAPAPLATFGPPQPYVPPPQAPTFTPTSTPMPQPTVSGIPRPRRTPILVEPPLE